jgi:hypothetical protein
VQLLPMTALVRVQERVEVMGELGAQRAGMVILGQPMVLALELVLAVVMAVAQETHLLHPAIQAPRLLSQLRKIRPLMVERLIRR